MRFGYIDLEEQKLKIPIAREGYRYIVPSVILAGAALYLRTIYALIPLAAASYLAYFFRDPRRVASGDDSTVIAPADGKIVSIEEVTENGYLKRCVQRVSIFMSIFDVHINYAPVTGKVDYMCYRKGSFKNAMRDIASSVNENNTIGIKCRDATMALRQIAGLIARRIVCRCAVGDVVRAGEKIGMIKFGSRVDLFLPAEARLSVSVGERVRGGETILARLS